MASARQKPLWIRGMSPTARGAALEDKSSWCGLIVDLHHVYPACLKIAIAAKGYERATLVTDAMATVGTDLSDSHFRVSACSARAAG